jgi:hypothetical protein
LQRHVDSWMCSHPRRSHAVLAESFDARVRTNSSSTTRSSMARATGSSWSSSAPYSMTSHSRCTCICTHITIAHSCSLTVWVYDTRQSRCSRGLRSHIGPTCLQYREKGYVHLMGPGMGGTMLCRWWRVGPAPLDMCLLLFSEDICDMLWYETPLQNSLTHTQSYSLITR